LQDEDALGGTGYDDGAVAALLAEVCGPTPPADDPGPQVDRAAELQAKWGTALGQVWTLGEHRLVCGDCTDPAVVASVMQGERADCAFTSPPYAVGVDYGEYDDTIDNLRHLLPHLAAACWDAVCDGGFAVVNFGDIASGRDIAKVDEPCEYPMGIEYWPVFRGRGWLLWSRRVWCKPNPRVHSPWCIQSNRAATDWEHLWTWKKPGAAIVRRVDGELRSALGWYQSSLMHGVDVGKATHGAGMALGIAEWMLNVHSRSNAAVFEPFCGTGTTLIACERLARKCRAVELSPAYVAVTLQRWADMTGRTPLLQSDGGEG
jgi:DNA modification methylase